MTSGHRNFVVQPERAAALGRERQLHTAEVFSRRWGHVVHQFAVDVGGRQATTEARTQRHIGTQLKALNFGLRGVVDVHHKFTRHGVHHSRAQLQVLVVVIEGRGIQRQRPAHQSAAHAYLVGHNAFGLELLDPGTAKVEAATLESL